MPSKRVKRTKQTEQERHITSTLLNLSLKFDNHLNAREIISLQQAKDYIREIFKLNIQSNDARSREVSEKLTSMLKALINEYTNTVTDTENSNTFSLYYSNVEKKLHENFESKSNDGLNIRSVSYETSVEATNADHSQNNLIQLDNIENRIGINSNISIPIDNMSKKFLKEGMPVTNSNDNSANVNRYKALIVENIHKRNVKDTNNKPSVIKNKTTRTNDTKMIADTECINNIILSKDSVKQSLKSKKKIRRKNKKNDLMWIENIKLIREIDREDHLVNNYGETWGRDFTKPANCRLDFESD